MRLKFLVSVNKESLPEDTDPETEFDYVDIGSVGQGDLVEEPHHVSFGGAPSRARRVARPGDVLISSVRTYLRAVWPVPKTSDPLVVSTGFVVLTPGPSVDAHYLGWLAQADIVVNEIVARSVGVSYPAVNPGDIGDLDVPVFPMERQLEIADFLDRAIATVGEVQAHLRELQQLLGARRQLLIHGLVSGSTLPGDRRPGPPWLETVPADWEVTKLTYVARLGSGHTPSRSEPSWWENCTIPWITTGEVSQMRGDRIERIFETRERISELGLANSSAVLHPEGTVVLCRTASAGYSAIMGMPMATSQDFATWTCGPRLLPEYLLFCLRAMREDLLGRLAMGSTHQTIYMPDIEAITIPLPPVEVQVEIVDEVRRLTAQVDSAVDMVESVFSLLAERRHILITEAVTGQLEIPLEAA